MNDIDKIIRQAKNPFESQLTPGNFWQEQQDTAQMVNSIHQEILDRVKATITQIDKSTTSRTLIISGDSGSGKSYLLGRIKRTLNQKAFFVYISPWPDSDYIWRHTLRQTVDSLVCKPEGKKDSQLILWIKSLSAFKDRGFVKWVLGKRKAFIHELNAIYPTGIYNANHFFGVLYDLTNPELYPLACNWLRGDDLEENDLNRLKVSGSIDSEDAAKNILGNFGKIAADTQPIVLCFDQLDNIPKSDNGYLDLQSLFNINSTIHNESFKKFLVIVSVITSTWRQNKVQIQPADLARVNEELKLKQISLEQAEALWALRLHPLHSQAKNPPVSNIFPLESAQLKLNFPGGKTLPRNALVLGRKLFEDYNAGTVTPPVEKDKLTAFKSVWQAKYQKIQNEIKNISLISEPELIKMLQEVLQAWELSEIKPKLLSGKYDVNSFSFRSPQNKRTGIVWIETPNMTKFCNSMKACKKVAAQSSCSSLCLIRSAYTGHGRLKGYQIYQQIFNNTYNRHVQPNLTDIHYLATYHELVKLAQGNELLVLDEPVSLAELELLIRQSAVMTQCSLLHKLNLVSNPQPIDDLASIKKFLSVRIENQQIIARHTLVDLTLSGCKGKVDRENISRALSELIEENNIKLMNPHAKAEEQIVCLVPH